MNRSMCDVSPASCRNSWTLWVVDRPMIRYGSYSCGPTGVLLQSGCHEHQVRLRRVSTHNQTYDLQFDTLAAASCAPEHIHTDTCSGSVACVDRPSLQQLRSRLRPGDTLVVWCLDCLGRNLQDLIGFVNGLRDDDVQFTSLTEQMDTATHMGRLIFQFFGALAEYERTLISERAAAGAAARARGHLGGRPRALTPEKLSTAQALIRDSSISVSQVCRTVGVSRWTLYRHLTPDGTLRREPRP